MAYGSATVRPYVGAVKRVALPIVSEAINRIDAPHFHRLSPASLLRRRSFKWNALENMVVQEAVALPAELRLTALPPRREGVGRHCGETDFSSLHTI